MVDSFWHQGQPRFSRSENWMSRVVVGLGFCVLGLQGVEKKMEATV